MSPGLRGHLTSCSLPSTIDRASSPQLPTLFKKMIVPVFFFLVYSFIWLHGVLVAAHRIFLIFTEAWGSDFLTRDQTRALYIGNAES